jgi:hypothetical protein
MLDASQLLWTRIGAAVCLLLAAGFLYNLLRLRGTARAAKGWSRVEGEIIASGVDLPPTHTSDDATDAAAVVRYRYHAGGAVHENDRIGFGGPSLTTRMLAAKHAARYPIGAKVDVYVDPRNPARAVLEPGRGDSAAALVVFAVTFAAIAAILVAHALAGHVLYTAKGVPVFAFGLPLACLAVAAASVVSFFRDHQRARASATWPNAPGRITRSAVVEETIEERPDEDEREHSAAPRRVRRYHVDLRYAYHVGGRDLTGTAVGSSWTPVFGRRADADDAAARYREGQLVTVHYDPADPSAAVIEPGDGEANMAPLVFALIFAAGGAGMLAFFVKVGFTS